MMGERIYFVYILTNKHNTMLYTGITNNLYRCLLEHRSGTGSKFTKRYNVTKLVYYEVFGDVWTAISKEKQIKAGSREAKIELIEMINTDWKDLFYKMDE